MFPVLVHFRSFGDFSADLPFARLFAVWVNKGCVIHARPKLPMGVTDVFESGGPKPLISTSAEATGQICCGGAKHCHEVPFQV